MGLGGMTRRRIAVTCSVPSQHLTADQRMILTCMTSSSDSPGSITCWLGNWLEKSVNLILREKSSHLHTWAVVLFSDRQNLNAFQKHRRTHLFQSAFSNP